jgi:MFS family permease
MTATTRSATPSNPVHLQRSLYAALGGTLFLRIAGGIMGILTSVFLVTKNAELGSGDHPYHISATLAGLIIASFFATELFGSFVSGRLIDHHGPRRYMIIGPLFGAAAMIVTALLHLRPDSTVVQFYLFLGMLLIARLLEGSSAATANPATLTYIAAYTSDNAKLRSRISGYFELMTLIGSIIGIVIGGMLFKYFGQGAFLLNTGFYLFSALVFASTQNVQIKHTGLSESHSLKAYEKLISSPRLRELIPAWLAVSALLGVLFNHAAFQLSNGKTRAMSEFGEQALKIFPGQTLSHAFDSQEVGLVFGLYAIAFGAGIVVWTYLLPRMRKSTAMLIGGVGVIASSILIYLLNHTGSIMEPSPLRLILIPLTLIAVMVESGFTPAALVYLSDISELHPENRGMVMGLYSFLFGFGQLAGTVVAGPFADWQGIDGLLLFMSILAGMSIFSVILLRRDEMATHEGLAPSKAEAATD